LGPFASAPTFCFNVGVRSVAARCVNSLRKLLPASLLPLVVLIRARLARLRPALWADAQAQMRFVVGDDQPDEVIDRLAAAYLKRSIWRGETRWHPELVTRQPVVGLEHLRPLHEAKTGFIINFVHHADYEGISPSLAWAGIPSHAVATSDMFSSDAPLWMQQSARLVDAEGVTMLDVAVGSAGIREVLARGDAVAIATDQPGHTSVRFLGHELFLSSGAARIAIEMKVPMVMVSSRPNPDNPDGCAILTVTEPLRPEEFGSAEELLELMIRHHEQAFLAWPEAAEQPLRMLDRSLVREPTRHRRPESPSDERGADDPKD
jgi:lauroyl/myristoyl acyltransferase